MVPVLLGCGQAQPRASLMAIHGTELIEADVSPPPDRAHQLNVHSGLASRVASSYRARLGAASAIGFAGWHRTEDWVWMHHEGISRRSPCGIPTCTHRRNRS